jgi:hypothetical protein
VDAATIDCEQVFRARIYWEPVPTPEPIEADLPVIDSYRESRPSEEPIRADAGGRVRRQGDGVLRPGPNRPVINRREKATATPNLVRKPSQARKWLLENIPYYDRIDGPLTRWNVKAWLPWVVVGLLVLVLLVNITNNGKKGDNNPASTTPGATAALTTTVTAAATTSVGNATSPVANGSPRPTATLSSAVPTATPAPPSPTPQQKTLATVVGTEGKGVKMRKDPHVTSANEPNNVITTIAEGQEVEITGPFKTAEGINWWPVNYKGQSGWIAQQYLQKK